MPNDNTRRNIYAREDAWREIEEAAKRRFMTVSAYVVQATLEKAREEQGK